MSEKYPIASGNWSNAANWNAGTKPVAGDDVYANGYTVTVDEDTADSLLSLNTKAGTTAVAGGTFLVTGTRSIYATSIYTGSEHCIQFSGGAGTTLTIDAAGGSLYGSVLTNSKYTLYVTGAGNVSLTGDVIGGNSSARNGIYLANASSTVTVVGAVSGGTNAAAYGITGNAAATIIVTGNVSANTGTAILPAAGMIITVTGNVTGGSTHAIGTTVAYTCTVIGNVSGASGAGLFGRNATWHITGDVISLGSQAGLYTDSGGGNVTVIGDVTAGIACPAINIVGTTSADVCQITGNITATSGASAVVMASKESVVYANGNITNFNARQAIAASRVFLQTSSTMTVTTKKWDGTTDFILYSAGALPGVPAIANVRSGTVYGASNELTGTLAVPAAGNVVLGVPVDNTVGTLGITPVRLYGLG